MELSEWHGATVEETSIAGHRRRLSDAIGTFAAVHISGEVVGTIRESSNFRYLTLMDGIADLEVRVRPGVLPAGTGPGTVLQMLARPCYRPRDRAPVWELETSKSGNSASPAIRKLPNQGPIAVRRQEVRRKHELPSWPNQKLSKAGIRKDIRRILLLCGRGSLVLADFKNAIGAETDKRLEIKHEYTGVQGQDAITAIAKAIDEKNRHDQPDRPDLIVILRGGGSDADFLIFDDDRVVEAISQSEIPVATAIGHSVHMPLASMAAVVSFDTPSSAGHGIRNFNSQISRQGPSYKELERDNRKLGAENRELRRLNSLLARERDDAVRQREDLQSRHAQLSERSQASHAELLEMQSRRRAEACESAVTRIRLAALKNGLWWTLWTALVAGFAVLGGMPAGAVAWLSAAPAAWAVFTYSGGLRAQKTAEEHFMPAARGAAQEWLLDRLSAANAPRHLRQALKDSRLLAGTGQRP